MSHLTEQAIQATFIRLLNERPLDKITVRDLAEECGISRNTFYYHYHDIYELLEKMFEGEKERMLQDMQDISTIRQSLTAALHFALENRMAILHIYNSVNRDMLERYQYQSSAIHIRRFVERQREADSISERDIDDLVFLLSSMIEGAIINILRDGLTSDIEALIENTTRLLDGIVRLALENSKKLGN